ncbi:hypothetical protein THAOC_18806, partial [Thalassiosira oceanica]
LRSSSSATSAATSFNELLILSRPGDRRPTPPSSFTTHQSSGRQLMGGWHHLRDSANCQRLFRAHSYIQATFPYMRVQVMGGPHGGSIFPSLNHGVKWGPHQ